MSDPTTTNTLASLVNSAISQAMSLGVDAVEAAIIVDFPILGYPGLKQLLEWVLGMIEGYFYHQAAAGATKVIIDIQVGLETSAVNSAFKNAQAAIATGDTSGIEQASKDLDSSFANLIHSDGSTPT